MEAEGIFGELDRGFGSQIPIWVIFIVQMLNLSQIQLSEKPEENTTPSPTLLYFICKAFSQVSGSPEQNSPCALCQPPEASPGLTINMKVIYCHWQNQEGSWKWGIVRKVRMTSTPMNPCAWWSSEEREAYGGYSDSTYCIMGRGLAWLLAVINCW